MKLMVYVPLLMGSLPCSVPTSVPPSVPTSVPPGVPTSVPASGPTSVPTSVPPGVPTSVPPGVPASVPTTNYVDYSDLAINDAFNGSFLAKRHYRGQYVNGNFFPG